MKENEFKENFKRTNNLYNLLKEDEESVLFASEKITKQLIKKLKISNYEKDNVFLKLYNVLGDVNINKEEEVIPTFVPFIEQKKNIDRSTLYLFNFCVQILQI